MCMDNAIPYILGVPVQGNQFFGRGNQIEQFFSMLNSHTLQPMRIMGLRRSGKTSFLQYVSSCNEANKLFSREKLRTVIAYVDLHKDITSVNNFCYAVIMAIHKVISTESKLPEEIRGFRTLSSWLEGILNKNLRCVVLLDEYEVLTDISYQEFDVSFFHNLRALCCNDLLSYFTWTTCSNFEISIISPQQRAQDKSSHFENIFHLKPIIIGGLKQKEVMDLIKKPIEKIDIKFNQNEIRLIEKIAGTIPFFVQVVAQEMYLIKKNRKFSKNLHETIMGELLYRNSKMDQLFNNYWKVFTKNEKHLLFNILEDETIKRSDTHDKKKFLDYGLVRDDGDSLYINGNLFKQWLKTQKTGDIPVVPNDNDVRRLVDRIEQIQELLDKLERRVTKLMASRALLNMSTQPIEYDQLSEQIKEIEVTITTLNDELFSKRNELLTITLGDVDYLELTSNVDDRLTLAPIDQVNILLSELLKLQIAIEKAGGQTPEPLYGIKEIVESKKVTLDEKRTKLKLAISIFGPKFKIERTIHDSSVKNLFSKFWKKIKTIIPKEKD